jgi:acyl-CoA hydrolase
MENHVVVRTAHLNHKGSLFGGQMLLWVDECAYMAAMMDFPGRNFVTRAISKVEFKKPVVNGSILRFKSDKIEQGSSSVTYKVNVFALKPGETEGELVFDTEVIFVAIDEKGNKTLLNFD